MKIVSILGSLFLAVFLFGCASVQQPIPVSSSLYEQPGKKIGIIRSQAPKAETQYTGSVGLLDYAIIAATNSSLDKHLATLSFPEYETFVSSLKPAMEAKGFDVVLIEKPLTVKESEKLKKPEKGISKNDFSQYKKQYGLDYLMVIHFGAIGTTRSYYGPAPTSEPVAMARIIGQIVDLNTNTLQWYSDLPTNKVIPAPWDESNANFPNLTNAVYQALDDSFRVIAEQLNNPSAAATQTVTTGK